ncbi:ribosome maturation factor RimP [Syntrophomonas wolfei]|nr:ribosome maturation factor RimP [Syntrophomonas wolfei]
MGLIDRAAFLSRIEEMVEERLNELELELVNIEYRKENKEQFLRVFIDKDNGVDLDMCSQANRAIKESFDEQEIPYDYLEVSSPGLDRVLKKERDWERFSGYRVRIKTRKSFPGPQRITGILLGFDSENIAVELEGELLKVPREMITIIRLHPEF